MKCFTLLRCAPPAFAGWSNQIISTLDAQSRHGFLVLVPVVIEEDRAKRSRIVNRQVLKGHCQASSVLYCADPVSAAYNMLGLAQDRPRLVF